MRNITRLYGGYDNYEAGDPKGLWALLKHGGWGVRGIPFGGAGKPRTENMHIHVCMVTPHDPPLGCLALQMLLVTSVTRIYSKANIP